MAISNTNATLEAVSAGDQTLYDTPNVIEAIITKAHVYNDSSSNVTLIVNIRRGSGAATSNRFMNLIVPSQGEGLPLSELVGTVLNSNDIISVNAGTGSALNIDFSIKEVTS